MTVRPFGACDAAAAQFPLSPVLGLVLAAFAGGAVAQTADTAPTLPKITVTGKAETTLKPAYAGGQIARGGSLGLLGQQDAMDVPFSTTNFTSELIQDLQARTIADVVVNDASVRMTTGSNGFDDTFQIRGYAVSATDVGVNGLYGLISQNRVPTQLVERAELLKGPGALVNGISPSGSVGGGINIVTKRASDVPLTRLTTEYVGRKNLSQAIDVGRRFGPDNAWGVRVNALVRGGEASIDEGNAQTGLGAIALDYNGGRLRWSLDAIYQEDNTDNFRPQISLDAVGTIAAPPDARSNWYPGTALTQRDKTIATRVEYDVTDKLTAYAALGYRDGMNDQTFPTSLRTAPVQSNGNFSVQNNWYDSYTQTYSGNAGLNWRFDTAGVGHTVSFGVSGLQQDSGFAYIQGGSTTSNIYNPSPLPAITASRTEPVKSSGRTLSSFAIADTLSLDNGRWLVTLGARDQTVRSHSYNPAGAQTASYDASTITPIGAVVFKPVDKVSVYASYTAGLTAGQTVGPAYANVGAVLDPYKSEQYEAGVKADWGTITTTAAVYQLSRPSAITNGANILAYDGEQRNRGLELSAYGEVLRGLRGTASMAFIDPKLTKTQGGVNEGNDAAGVPDFTASVGADWTTPWVPGLAVNGRVLYTSGAYLNAANTQKFDAWTRVDLGARYKATIAGTPVTFRGNVENLFNKTYWLTTGTYVAVGSPRTLVLSAAVDF